MGNWIEVVNEQGCIDLINLNNVSRIELDIDTVRFICNGGPLSVTSFDNKYDSLVDFINSKRVDM